MNLATVTGTATKWDDKPGCPGVLRRSYADGIFYAEIMSFEKDGLNDDPALNGYTSVQVWREVNGRWGKERELIRTELLNNNSEVLEFAQVRADQAVIDWVIEN